MLLCDRNLFCTWTLVHNYFCVIDESSKCFLQKSYFSDYFGIWFSSMFHLKHGRRIQIKHLHDAIFFNNFGSWLFTNVIFWDSFRSEHGSDGCVAQLRNSWRLLEQRKVRKSWNYFRNINNQKPTAKKANNRSIIFGSAFYKINSNLIPSCLSYKNS